MKQSNEFCNNGHWYDKAQYSECPFCVNSNGKGPTKPAPDNFNSGSYEGSKPGGKNDSGSPIRDDVGITRPYTGAKTVDEEGIDPVAGWLVCIEGINKGRDYRVRCGYNTIGRDPSMRIHIGGDENISRDTHATVLYDPRDKLFMIERGKATGIIRINENLLTSGMELKPYDTIDFGKTKLLFVPFCGENFNWE